jgi:hypothetical protein
MNVYVESNFVLELALEQEECESCEQLVRLTSAGSIRLVIPAFSLAEPHWALAAEEKARSKLSEDLQAQLRELGRSKPYRDMPGKFGELAGALVRTAEQERQGLDRTIESVLEAAQVIPLDADVIFHASALEVDFGMSAQDSLVLAAVFAHLVKTKAAQSCFLNRYTKDFNDPNVRKMLDEQGCKLFGRFDQGLRFVESCIARGTSELSPEL